VGVSDLKETRVGTNLVWTPLAGFDIGAEFMYARLNQTRPGWPRSRFDPHRNRSARVPAQHQPILDPPANPARVLNRLGAQARTQRDIWECPDFG
jgi:hypothetical protein